MFGDMKSDEKNDAMARFVSGETSVLVATTVVEVGVNVPNASVMLIENAERFGLSQLHQLRGRVGRGRRKSYCALLSDARSETAARRLKALETTNDGFKISALDLELRGPGDFFGVRQHGVPEFKIANLCRDADILAKANAAAEKILSENLLASPEFADLRRLVMKKLDEFKKTSL
jgi:ATP-dependent DNA helicase RecG